MAKMCFSLVFALLVALHMGSNSVETTMLPPEDGQILYSSRNRLARSIVEMPASCAGKTYCFDKGANYPDDKIEKLLADMRELSVESPPAGTDFGDRFGDTDEPDCASTSTENPIYYITDINDKVRVVVQSKAKFMQIFSVTWCTNEGQIKHDTPHFFKSTTLNIFKMECVSTMMDFQFFVLSDEVDPVTKEPKMEPAKVKGGIPVCCKCRYDTK